MRKGMQRGRADARQLSRAFCPANNGTSPGRLIPPHWDLKGNRLLLPPAPWPPTCPGGLHPMPVDLSALGDEMKIPLRRPLGNPKAIRLPLWESHRYGATANGDDLAATRCPTPSTRVSDKGLPRRLRLQLKQSWERLGPSVKIRCGLKAVHPDVSVPAVIADAQSDEVGVLVHDWDLQAW